MSAKNLCMLWGFTCMCLACLSTQPGCATGGGGGGGSQADADMPDLFEGDDATSTYGTGDVSPAEADSASTDVDSDGLDNQEDNCLDTANTDQADADGHNDIYVMKADGTNPTRLTFTSANNRRPTFTADGQRILFDSDRDGNDEIYIMNADGSAQTNLTNNPADDTNPAVAVPGFEKSNCNQVIGPAN